MQALQALAPLAPLPVLRARVPVRRVPRGVRLPRRRDGRVGDADDLRQVLARDAVLRRAVRPCGNVFAHQSAAHWNGGGGCRDQQRLSTKDSRKHKGANVAGVKKTTSGKSQRVGAAGKKAVAAKVASRAE